MVSGCSSGAVIRFLLTFSVSLKRLASLLIVTQLVNQVTEVVIPFLVDRFISAPHRTESEDDSQEDKFRNQSTLPTFPVRPYDRNMHQGSVNCSLAEFDRVLFLSQGLFAEYIELLVQFGSLSLFSCVFPLTAVLLLLNNLTEIRSDAYKICRLFRKPFSPPVANMGVWQVSSEHDTNGKQEVCHVHFTSVSLLSGCLRGPELCLRCVQLLAAAAVATVTGAASGGQHEQHQHPADGCCGGGKSPQKETHANIINAVWSLDVISFVCDCSMC